MHMLSHGALRAPKRSGFTLIELLVVIAIIAILAAILFPVFSKVREKGRQSACMSNQKQIVMAALMFCQENEETLPEANVFWSSLGLPLKVLACPSSDINTNGNTYVASNRWMGKSLGKVTDATMAILTCDGTHVATDETPTAKATYNSIGYRLKDVDNRHFNGKTRLHVMGYLDGHVEIGAGSPGFMGSGPAGTVEIPTNGLALWLKADLAGLVSPVETWTDASGNGNDAVSSNGNFPTLTASDSNLNGKPSLTCSNTTMETPDLSGLFAGEGGTYFVVGYVGTPASGTRYGFPAHSANGPADEGNWDGYQNASLSMFRSNYAAYPFAAPEQTMMMTVVSDTAAQSYTMYNKGTAAGNGGTYNFLAPSILNIGGGYGSQFSGFVGSIAEIIMYNRPLTSSERTQTETYLKTKYGL